MTAAWQQPQRAQRPDPYLEWEVRTRPGLPGSRTTQERWCSVHIQAVPDANGDTLENLRKFHTAIVAGRLPKDTAQKQITIRMAGDELKLLDDVASGKMGQHKVVFRFFIYRLESLIYADGGFASTEFYTVISAGPPIVDLKFNEEGPNDITQIVPSPGLLAPVAIGIIDDGIAFAHERFRSGRAESRIEAIWLQDAERRDPDKPGADNGVAFGQRLTRKDIDELLAEHATDDDIYREVGLTDFGTNKYNPLARRASHGTHVLDLAAGRDPRDSVFGRPILAVKLPSVATLDTSGVTMGSYVVQAVRQIMLWAEALGANIPLVINFSYGMTAGPKDGTHNLELVLRDLVAFRTLRGGPTRLVLPAGNSFRTRTTAVMTLAAGEEKTVDWMILPDDETPNFVEVWLDPQVGAETPSPVEVTVSPPDVLPRGSTRLESGRLSPLIVDEKAVAAMYYDVRKANNGMRGRIFIAINQTASKEGRLDCAPSGRWRVTLKNVLDSNVEAHLYIQRDSTPFGYARPGRQSYFDHSEAWLRDDATGTYDRLGDKCPIKHIETLSAIATSDETQENGIVVVGAANGSAAFLPADYASSGPTRLRDGPDYSAVVDEGDGHWGVLAAGTFGGSIVRLDGSSVAAPQLARKIADDLERRGSANFHPLDTADGDLTPVPPREAARLGTLLLRRPAEDRIPRRRYPAVES